MSFLSKLVVWIYLFFLVAWAFVWRGHLPCYIDASLYAYPDHWVNLEAFRKGLLPLWNPFIACGTPHAANWQSACFYPPFWLFNLTGLSNAFMPMAVVHAGLAFVGCTLWLRRLKVAPLWCALGALSFAGSAHLTRCWANLPFIATAAWIPWVFWAFHRALERGGRNWALAGLFLSLQVFAGYPFFTFYTVVFLVAWFAFQKPSLQTWRFLGLTLAGTALVTALQWLPFLEMLTYAKPGAWTQYPYFDRPLDYLTLLKPDILGIPGSVSYRGPFANGMFVLYFGLIPLVIFLLNIFVPAKPERRFWIFASLFWLIWMVGVSFPLWRLIPMGLLEWLEPSKAVGLFLFCAVTLVALSLNRFFESRLAPKKQIAVAVVLVVLWMLDLGRLPFLLLEPMKDPFQRVDIRETAEKITPLLAGGRMLSLHNPEEMAFSGTQDEAFGRAFNFPVEMFLANSNAVWGIRSADRYLFLQVDGSENLTRYYNRGKPDAGDLLDIAGVRAFLIPQPLPAPKYKLAGKIGNDFLSLNPQASQDMRWVPESAEFPDRPSILNTLSRPNSQWQRKVYLEKNSDGSFVSLPPVRRNHFQMMYINPDFSFQHSNEDGTCWWQGHSPKTGFVALNESYTPGWHAWVDGNPKPILRAYGLFMAVAVDKGPHTVDFRYEPTSFRLGLFLTLVSLAFVAVGFLKSSLIPGKFRKKK